MHKKKIAKFKLIPTPQSNVVCMCVRVCVRVGGGGGTALCINVVFEVASGDWHTYACQARSVGPTESE